MLAQDKCDEAAKAAIEFEEILGKGNYFLEIRSTVSTLKSAFESRWSIFRNEQACRSSRPTTRIT